MKNKKSVIETIINEIKNGMLLRKPIVYLKTSDLGIVRKVINSDQIVVRMKLEGADTMLPFQSVSQSVWHGPLIDQRVINIVCGNLCDLKSSNQYICNTVESDEEYGRMIYGDKRTNAKSTRYLLPSMLVLSLHKSTEEGENNNNACFEKLIPFIDRYTQETDDNCAIRSSLILLYGEDENLPKWILPYSFIVEEPYPEKEEIKKIIRDKSKENDYANLSDDIVDSYANSFLGSRLLEVESTVDYLLNLPDDPITNRPIIQNKDEVGMILAKLREQNVKRVGLLELMRINDKEELGGMERFINQWIEENSASIINADRICDETGADRQKGILMCGIPGCGKSAAVKVLSLKLNLPVLTMDIGKLMGCYVGESEHNMYNALHLAEAMSPCILYIDEIEKGFSGSDGSDDNGVTRRMFGILLTWMQECKKSVYIFATANSLNGLPKEFFRSGRFDSLFSLLMPTYRECISIFKMRMHNAEQIVREKQGENTTLFTNECYCDDKLGYVVNYLVSERDSEPQHRFVTGADITKIVNMSLRQFDEKKRRPIVVTDWIDALVKSIDNTTVYGTGEDNLLSIAACYIQMMRLGFTPTSAENDTLFSNEDYHVEYTDEGPKVVLTEKKDFYEKYDKVLYHTIYEKINILAKRLEENSIKKLIS